MAQHRTPPPRNSGRLSVDADAVRAHAAEVAVDAGLDLEDVQIRRAGNRLLVRVLVDRDGGVTLDEAAVAAQRISGALDDSGVMGEAPYVLDVGSPGVDRPLTLLRHWQRNTGRVVRITAADGSILLGRIEAADGPAGDEPPAAVTVITAAGPEPVPLATVRRAVVQVEFGDTEPED